MQTENELSPVLLPAEFQPTMRRVFPTINSLMWFMRENQAELAKLGAVVRPTGRWLINPEKMEKAVLAIGERRACRA